MFIKHFTQVSYIYSPVLSDHVTMEGLTVNEIGSALGIHPKAAKMRLRARGLKPVAYAGPTAIYDPAVVDLVRVVSKGGRPRKTPRPGAGGSPDGAGALPAARS